MNQGMRRAEAQRNRRSRQHPSLPGICHDSAAEALNACEGSRANPGAKSAVADIQLPDQRAFWTKVERGSADACWPWRGALRAGYGVACVRRNGKKTTRNAHRIAYELTAKTILERGIEVMHECDNPLCCNPSHLSLGTHAENMDDRERKGRGRGSGIRPGNAIALTAEGVREIRRRRLAGERLERRSQ